MTTHPQHRNDPFMHGPGSALWTDPGRATARQALREPLGLVSHWYPHEELALQTDLYA